MFTVLLILSLLTFSIGAEEAAVVGNFVAVSDNNEVRALGFALDTLANSVALGGLKVTVDANGNWTNGDIHSQVDAGGFKFAGGVNLLSDPQISVATLEYSTDFKWDATPSGGNVNFNIDSAWSQVVFGFSYIFLYKEQNANPGFQYTNLGDNIWGCTDSNTNIDCLITGSDIKVQDLVFDPIAYSSESCISALGSGSTAGYNETCTIYQLTSIGRFGSSTGPAVLTLSTTLASQKILLNPDVNGGHEVGPDYTKIDITINYPYEGKSQNKTGSYITFLTYASGQAGSGSIKASSFQGKSSLEWVGDNDKASVLAWDGTATLTTGTTDHTVNVYFNAISGQTIIDYNCDVTKGCNLGFSIVLAFWKIGLQVLKGFGWTTEYIFLSWDLEGADQVAYDPVLGATTAGNSGYFLGPTYLSLLWVFVHIVYHYLN